MIFFDVFLAILQPKLYIGRGLHEDVFSLLKYTLFWIMLLISKLSFSYYVEILPLVAPTKIIMKMPISNYQWHEFFPNGNISNFAIPLLLKMFLTVACAYYKFTFGTAVVTHNIGVVIAIWAPIVLVYFMDAQIWYAIFSTIFGGIHGAFSHLGEIRTLGMLRSRFESVPSAFSDRLMPSQNEDANEEGPLMNEERQRKNIDEGRQRKNIANFSQVWNEFITSMRWEDLISNRDRDLLLVPYLSSPLSVVQWPPFLLASKIPIALDMAKDFTGKADDDLFKKIKSDDYMYSAVIECYQTLRDIIDGLLEDQADKKIVEWICDEVDGSIDEKRFLTKFRMSGLPFLSERLEKFLKLLLAADENDDNSMRQIINVLQDIMEIITQDVMINGHEILEEAAHNIDPQNVKKEQMFQKLKIDQRDKGWREKVVRLHLLLTVKESAINVPQNLDARRRITFFANSLFMNMPRAPKVRDMLSFSVLTPYYKEDVIYSDEELNKENEDGISVLFYLQKIYPDEWTNFQERLEDPKNEIPGKDRSELTRQWVSYRAQTLSRTVRGMMYYRKALDLQCVLETAGDSEASKVAYGYVADFLGGYQTSGLSENDEQAEQAFLDRAQALADLKFTYVVSCQIYGAQKNSIEARDKSCYTNILKLMLTYPSLRVAYIDTTEEQVNGRPQKTYFSVLVKGGDKWDEEIYRIKLPGPPTDIGEGKPENQNHAIIFTRGEALQTIDMNQDNYFEEAFKMRNVLEEFLKRRRGNRKPTILGLREHIFTGSVSSLAWFMSNQETSFVTIGQRILANPLRVRFHYGHPDIFDRIFHITRGGISKASKIINLSEDIFAGYNSTMRGGFITHHEYIQVGKGRDVGMNQISLFEAKVSNGNGEQTLSRDVYRLGRRFDFFRMMSFYFTTIGFYFSSMVTVLIVYVFLYGRMYMVMSGLENEIMENPAIHENKAFEEALATQSVFQLGLLLVLPMVMEIGLEKGFRTALGDFIIMQLQLASVFFTFQLGTKAHYYGRTILHGGSKYRATGRGFVVVHAKFSENYRLYSRSHFVKGLELLILLIVYGVYGESYRSSNLFWFITFSMWFLVASWLFAPFIFNPSSFDWQKTVDDWTEWKRWMGNRGGIGISPDKSWESWWDEEQEHLKYTVFRGRILEIILALRFLIYQYGIVYHLDIAHHSKSLLVYGLSWVVMVTVLLVLKMVSMGRRRFGTDFQLMFRILKALLFLGFMSVMTVLFVVFGLTISDLFAAILAFLPTGWALLLADVQRARVLGINQGAWKSIRLHNGTNNLHAGSHFVMVPVCIRVPNTYPLQPSIQQRPADFQDPCREEGQDCVSDRNLEISICIEAFSISNGTKNEFRGPSRSFSRAMMRMATRVLESPNEDESLDSIVVPPGLPSLARIFRVADEIEKDNPRVAYLCRFHGFEEAHKMDPTSSVRGFRQFKTLLLNKLEKSPNQAAGGRRKPKTNFVEVRTFWHLYRSFDRMWIFLILAFQAMLIVAWSPSGSLTAFFDADVFRSVLSIFITYAFLNLLQATLDIILSWHCWKSLEFTQILRYLLKFAVAGVWAVVLPIGYSSSVQSPTGLLKFFNSWARDWRNQSFYNYAVALYLLPNIMAAVLLFLPPLRRHLERSNWRIVTLFMWWAQASMSKTNFLLPCFLCGGLRQACLRQISCCLVILPLVAPTKIIMKIPISNYQWHEFFPNGNISNFAIRLLLKTFLTVACAYYKFTFGTAVVTHNIGVVIAIWAPIVLVYFMDAQIWYAIFSTIFGGIHGAFSHLGEIRTLGMLRSRFESVPSAFSDRLMPSPNEDANENEERQRKNIANFSHVWNEFITSMREEDLISNSFSKLLIISDQNKPYRDRDLLLIPYSSGDVSVVQWPHFLLASKIPIALDMARYFKGKADDDLFRKIKSDNCMYSAVTECYQTLRDIIYSLLEDEADKKIVEWICSEVDSSIQQKRFLTKFRMSGLLFLSERLEKFLKLLLAEDENVDNSIRQMINVLQDIMEIITQDVMINGHEILDAAQYFDSQTVKKEQRFQKLKIDRIYNESWREKVVRLHLLLTVKESAINVPQNLDARRRINFFANSLFMNMPRAPKVRDMLSFSVLTPYYKEDVLYSDEELNKENEDGISILFYLQKIYPDEWTNFQERLEDPKYMFTRNNRSELTRQWVSYRAQTLSRTVRGMMYYRRALDLQCVLETAGDSDFLGGYQTSGLSENDEQADQAFLDRAQALADLKFTYKNSNEARDRSCYTNILKLMLTYPSLRVAYIDTTDEQVNGKPQKTYFSVLVKGRDKWDEEIYRIKLPGPPTEIGEGRPENQNHAIIFTRGEALQTIDMNQDNYFEEAFKMRNVLEEFLKHRRGNRKPTILGLRDHIFSGSISSLAWFSSNQETSFVTIGQRTLANLLRVRFHYGHADIFDRIFHITRGGISKASKVINLSDDIFAGYNSTMRGGFITHHEYIQVGKGRDMGINQLSLFEAKVSNGNGEQTLSRDVYRLGRQFDFFRMLSFYFTTIGFYFSSMVTVLVVYVFLYGRMYMVMSGLENEIMENPAIHGNKAFEEALAAQSVFQLGLLLVLPMVMEIGLEKGFRTALGDFVIMQLQLASVFFTFQLGTKAHYYGRTILHGASKYRATGRGFVVHHAKFSENYRLYSRSHFVKGLEVLILLIVYGVYGQSYGSSNLFRFIIFSLWFLVASWLFAPFIFNPSSFDWQKIVDDWTEWNRWMGNHGRIGISSDKSWESWWNEEQEHLKYTGFRGRILEIILAFRFLIYQYGIVYHLDIAHHSKSLRVYGLSWVVLVTVLLVLMIVSMGGRRFGTNFHLRFRILEALLFLGFMSAMTVLFVVCGLTISDLFAAIPAFLPTGWALLLAGVQLARILGINQGAWKSVRLHNGTSNLHVDSHFVMVSVCITVPNTYPLQPSIQQRPADFQDSCRKERQDCFLDRNLKVSIYFEAFSISKFISVIRI
ncbi:unnamed protein product [Malus baccata var. baccata]